MDGTRLLRRAMKLTDLTQREFARQVMRVSSRTLTRMLAGERAIADRELDVCRLIIARNGRPA